MALIRATAGLLADLACLDLVHVLPGLNLRLLLRLDPGPLLAVRPRYHPHLRSQPTRMALAGWRPPGIALLPTMALLGRTQKLL